MKKECLKVDFHSHILPAMDDGAPSAEVSVALMKLQQQQDINRIFATPHFYRHNETIDAFIARRYAASEALKQYILTNDLSLPKYSLGAEVSVEHDLHCEDKISELELGNTGYILLEIPFTGYHDWMAEKMYNICCRSHLKPMIAHLDRYYTSMRDSQIDDLLSFDDVAIQINSEAFSVKPHARFALDLINDGYTVVIGSDTHNAESRPPEFSYANKYLNSKLKRTGMNEFIQMHLNLARE